MTFRLFEKLAAHSIINRKTKNMQIISLIQALWVVLIIIFFFAKLRIGLCMYVAYIMLVPYMNIDIGVNLQWNFVNLILLFAFFINWTNNKGSKKIDIRPFSPFLFLFIVRLLEIPFQDDVPLEFSLDVFRKDLMQFLILPFVIWNYSRIDKKMLAPLRTTTVVSICIAFIYGLFLTTTNGINPYQIVIQAANGVEWDDSYSAVVEGRLFGRISSVFKHPMTYGLFLGLSLTYIYSIRESLKRYQMVAIFSGLVVAIFLCGIRSPIGALFATVIVFLGLSHKVKLMIQIGLLGCAVYFILSVIPEMGNYVGSIFSDEKSNTSGSSIGMRFAQLEGCFQEISNNPIFGKGYSWDTYYIQNHGDHPVILSFESIAFSILCDGGYLGVLIFLAFLIYLFKRTSQICKNREVLICALMVITYYLSYSLITGDYRYMVFMILFYVLTIINGNEKQTHENSMVRSINTLKLSK